MSYYWGQVQEKNGEKEYTHDMLIKAATIHEAEAELEYRAATWYRDNYEEDWEGVESEDGLYDHDGIIVEVYGIKEIPAEHGRVLEIYFPEW